MKKLFSVLMIGLIPALATAGEVREMVHVRTEARPVVSVIALSEEQANELARVRGEYRTEKERLNAEYEARLDALLARTDNTNQH